MKAETLMELLVGVVILGAIGWLTVQVFDMKGTLGSVDSKVTATSDRVERIAAILPDLRIKVAMEEVGKPVQGAVVVTEPVKDASGKWVAAVHVFDTVAGQRQTYVVNLKGPNDKGVAYLVGGFTSLHAKGAISFRDLERLSSDIGKPAPAPDYVLSESSFALRKASFGYSNDLTKALGVSPRTTSLSSKLATWDTLSAELRDNASTYKPD